MQEEQSALQITSFQLRAVLALIVVALLSESPSAVAASLKNVVRDLYGGDGIVLQPSPPPFPTHAPHFTASSLQGLDSLNTALSSNLGLFAFNSTVTGFTFDIERGIPVRTTESLGPLLAERAPTIGARRLNVAFAYTHLDFKRFEGTQLSDLSLTLEHEDTNGNGIRDTTGIFSFESDDIHVDLDLKIREDVFAFFATYGLTRHWDVGVVVPIIHVHVRAAADATIVRNSPVSQLVHNFGPQSDAPRSTGGGDETGIGDIILRTKYNFLRERPIWPDLAIVGDIKLPSGNEDDLLGTGETNFRALLVASKTLGLLTPHLNVGYEITTGDSEQDNFRYVVGFDARLHPKVTGAIDVLGRWEPQGDGIGDNMVDLALGAKWNIFGTFLLNGIVQLPLNRNEGLRPNVIWTVGIENTF
ncbi:MAG TPA: transporter [Candidatus Tectomicrobia bacterium]|nr:transporter [Candidatus Tectomicrobia bacterium]